jgi:hypothetical protein
MGSALLAMAPVCVANTLGTLERPAADGCAEDAACPVSAFYAAQAYSRLHQVQPGHATPSSLSVGFVTAARPALVSIAAMVFLAPALAAFAQRRVRINAHGLSLRVPPPLNIVPGQSHRERGHHED